MKRGVVVRLRGERAILLTPDGDFVEVAVGRRQVVVGQEVAYEDAPRPPRRAWGTPWIPVVLATCLAFFFCVNVIPPEKTHAQTLWVESSRSVEIQHEDGKVEAVHGAPKTGEEKLSAYVRWLIQQQYRQGQIRPGGTVLLTETPDGRVAKRLQQTLEQTLHLPVDIRVLVVSEKIVTMAREYHLSPGKYLAWETLRRTGHPIAAREIQHQPVDDLLKMSPDISVAWSNPPDCPEDWEPNGLAEKPEKWNQWDPWSQWDQQGQWNEHQPFKATEEMEEMDKGSDKKNKSEKGKEDRDTSDDSKDKARMSDPDPDSDDQNFDQNSDQNSDQSPDPKPDPNQEPKTQPKEPDPDQTQTEPTQPSEPEPIPKAPHGQPKINPPNENPAGPILIADIQLPALSSEIRLEKSRNRVIPANLHAQIRLVSIPIQIHIP